jgi:hypothetical protein
MLLWTFALLWTNQEIDHPQFKYWSGCKPESWVTMKMETDHGGVKISSETTYKLLEVKADGVFIEISGKAKVGAREISLRAQKQEIKAKESTDKLRIENEGDEEIEIAGKKLQCHWYEFTVKAGEETAKTKAWMSKEIPGGMAKTELLRVGIDNKPVTMTASEWEKK